jgi:hypothetical protein
MCLIIYSPDAKLPARETFFHAAEQNPNGIGVMSERGVERWIGRRATKRAWSYVRKLADAGVPFGVHFRWTTHGKTDLANCHPHSTKTGAHVMHNGVLGATSSLAKGDESDTALYVKMYLADVTDYAPVLPLIGAHIGGGNKFLVMDERAEFHLVNDWAGYWIGDLWYSNDYSLDDKLCAELERMYPRQRYLPEKKLPALGNTAIAADEYDRAESELFYDDVIAEAYEVAYYDMVGCGADYKDICADVASMSIDDRATFNRLVDDYIADLDYYGSRSVRV